MIGRGSVATPSHPRLRSPDPIEGAQSGLTLIEMIIALAIGMLIVVFLAEGTGLIRHFSLVQHRISAQDEILAVRDHLRGQIESTMRQQGELQQSSFAGVADTVVFTAPSDRLLETGGPLRITLAVVAEGGRMTLSETRAAQQQKGRTTRLIVGAERVSFFYYGALAGNSGAAWTSEWTDPEASPSLVRIDVTFPGGDQRRWPPFVVFMPSGGAPSAQTASSAPALPPHNP